MEIFFLTTNKAKLERAVESLLPEIIVKNIDLEVDEPQSEDQKYVAFKKVEQAFNIIKKPIFSEDSGFFISKYNNFPGVITKQVVSGLGKEGIKKIMEKEEKGYFQTTLAYKDEKIDFSITKKVYGKFCLDYLNKDIELKRFFGSIFIPEGFSEPYVKLDKTIRNNLLEDLYLNFKNKILANSYK